MGSKQTTQTTQTASEPKPPSIKENIETDTKTSPSNVSANRFVHNIIDYNYNQMDDHNKKAADVMKTQGLDAAIQHMFTDQETGRQLTYGEMRARYG